MSRKLRAIRFVPGLDRLAGLTPSGVLEINSEASDEGIAMVLDDIAYYLRTGRSRVGRVRRHLAVVAGAAHRAGDGREISRETGDPAGGTTGDAGDRVPATSSRVPLTCADATSCPGGGHRAVLGGGSRPPAAHQAGTGRTGGAR